MRIIALVLLTLILGCADGGSGNQHSHIEVEVIRYYKGMNYLAGMSSHFPVEEALRVFDGFADDEYPAIGVLYGTFGTNPKLLQQFAIGLGEKHGWVHIYLFNAVCLRKDSCSNDGSELFPSEEYSLEVLDKALAEHDEYVRSKISRRLENITLLAAHLKHLAPNLSVSLAVALEDDFSFEAAYELEKMIAIQWPYILVSNPTEPRGVDGVRDTGFGYLFEMHGANALHNNLYTIISNDGWGIRMPHRESTIDHTISLEEAKQYLDVLPNRKLFLAWDPLHQGLHGDSSEVAPKDRELMIPEKDIDFFNLFLRGLL